MRAAGSHAPAWPSVYFQLRASSSSASKPAEQPKIAEPGGAPDAADVPRVLAVGVLGDVVRDQVAPLGAIHAVDPHVGRLHHVSVCVHQHTSER